VAHISIDGGARGVQVELLPAGQVRVDNTVFAAEDLGHGAWRVVSNGKATRVWAAGPREHPWIYFDNVVYRPRLGPGREAPSSKRGPGDASAGRKHRDDLAPLSPPMPATVRAVLVTTGQTVARGETIVILEAMKMELPVRAPHDGVVTAISCQPGELVQPGTPLVEIQ
jgi:biotin carboxyl carrier protein